MRYHALAADYDGTLATHGRVEEQTLRKRVSRARKSLEKQFLECSGIQLDDDEVIENDAWEGYRNNGNDFLRRLYGQLEADDRFETVRVSEFLEANPPTVELPGLHSGSWIDANYRVWIGEQTHLQAWTALEMTRSFAQRQWGSLREMPSNVRQALMVAEGSDWFWWYSSRNSSPEDAVFDALYRANLEVVWWFAGAEPPDLIRQPLLDPARTGRPAGGAMLPGRS